MVEGQELKGVARTAATASAGLLLGGVVLAIVSLVLPWWTGTSALGTVADKRTVRTSITLWSLHLTIGKQVSDGAGGTTLETADTDMSWDQLCSATDKFYDGEGAAICWQVQAVRAFGILSLLFGLPGVLALLQSRTVSPLLLVLGAFLGSLQGTFSMLGIVLAIMMSTSGLAGLGVICLLGAAVISFIGVAIAFYGAGVAMPVDPPPLPKRMTRRDRVQDQLKKDEELNRELEARNPNQGRPQGFLAEGAESDAGGSSVQGKKVPVMLKRVLFWSQEHSGDPDADSIPTELLEMAFREIDEDGSGSIDMEELVENLALCGLNASVEATTNIMKEIDKDCSGDIDIIEFVGFFRELEELDRFQAKSQQRAQFVTFLCVACFIIHIIVVSALLMVLIDMEEADNPDNYLLMQNALFAFSLVLAFLLVWVICIPAIRLTMGANLAAWQRQYNAELALRMKKKPMDEDEGQGQGPRQAAWGAGGGGTAEGLTELTVNSAMFGASYRVSKQNMFLESAQQQAQATMNPMALERDRRGGGQSRAQSKSNMVQDASRRGGGGGVVAGKGGGFERYHPDAYRAAAQAAMVQRAPASFSPMQVRDMDMPRQEEPEPPGFLALEAGSSSPPGVLTGTGYYTREL